MATQWWILSDRFDKVPFMFRAVLSLIFMILISLPGIADQKIYKWVSPDGSVSYSTKKPKAEAEVAKLPPIMRAEVKIPENTLESCESHGGIDCQAGPDGDGSVICMDGFTAASGRYTFSCNSPRLKISHITDPALDGTFTVTVRNSKSVEASRPTVNFTQKGGGSVRLNGPAKIEPFGIGEFTIEPKDAIDVIRKPTLAQLSIDCLNCS